MLLISDGLDADAGEGLAFEAERLANLRRLVWLNPLLRYAGFEARPAGIRALLPYVDDFLPVHNLASLRELRGGAVAPARRVAAPTFRMAGLDLSWTYTQTRTIGAPPAAVWAALNDPVALKACIPGCETFERVTDTEWRSVVATRIGPVQARFNGKILLRT